VVPVEPSARRTLTVHLGAWWWPFVVATALWLPCLLVLGEAVGSAASVSPDARQGTLLGRSLLVAGGSAALAVLLGAPVAVTLGRLRPPADGLLRGLQCAPLVLPPYVTAIGWLHLLGHSGSVTAFLSSALGGAVLPDMYSEGGVIWVLGLWLYPLVALGGLAALQSAPQELEEQALLVARPGRVMVDITLPQAAPGIAAGAVMAFILALGEYTVPSFLSVNVYASEIFVRFGAFFDFAGGALTALPLLAISLGCAALLRARYLRALPSPALPGQETPLGRGGWRLAGTAISFLLPAIAVGLPLAALGSRAPQLTDYAQAWQIAREDVIHTLEYAALAYSLGVALALSLGRALARPPRGRTAGALEGSILGSAALPGAVLGIGMIRFWNRGAPFAWVYGSAAVVVLAEVARALPFIVALLLTAWRRLPREYEEAAICLGAGERRVWRSIIWPQLRPMVLATWGLGYVLAAADVQATLLVYPPGCGTLPIRIYTLQHDGIMSNVAALCCLQVAAMLFPVLALWAGFRLAGRRP